MKKLIPIFASFTLLLVVATPALASHPWGNYHWGRIANPFTLKLGDNVDTAWDASLATASSDWSASSVLDTTIVTGLTNPRVCKGTTGRIEVCNATYGNNGWLGLASISINSANHITKGTAKMNDTYFNTATYNTSAWRQMVMCQEVAHDFGLGHQDEAFANANLGTCMDYTNNPSTNQHPNQGDLDQLRCIYDPAVNGQTLTTATHSCVGTGHLDLSTTVGQLVGKALGAARAALKGENAENEEFGTPIGFDAHDRANVFAKKVGDETVVTHVLWLSE
jgi:hypothetical protein